VWALAQAYHVLEGLNRRCCWGLPIWNFHINIQALPDVRYLLCIECFTRSLGSHLPITASTGCAFLREPPRSILLLLGVLGKFGRGREGPSSCPIPAPLLLLLVKLSDDLEGCRLFWPLQLLPPSFPLKCGGTSGI